MRLTRSRQASCEFYCGAERASMAAMAMHELYPARIVKRARVLDELL